MNVEITERYHFHKREQAAGESVVQYLEELRRLVGRCNFGRYLDEGLRDRFVCGLKNDHIQKGLLAEADLDLGKAIKRATAMEAAQKHTSTEGLATIGSGCNYTAAADTSTATSIHTQWG